MDFELMIAIGLGMLLGTIFTRIFDWALGAVQKK
jgi:hypothetical protein